MGDVIRNVSFSTSGFDYRPDGWRWCNTWLSDPFGILALATEGGEAVGPLITANRFIWAVPTRRTQIGVVPALLNTAFTDMSVRIDGRPGSRERLWAMLCDWSCELTVDVPPDLLQPQPALHEMPEMVARTLKASRLAHESGKTSISLLRIIEP